jgi:hypothetical protein
MPSLFRVVTIHDSSGRLVTRKALGSEGFEVSVPPGRYEVTVPGTPSCRDSVDVVAGHTVRIVVAMRPRCRLA